MHITGAVSERTGLTIFAKSLTKIFAHLRFVVIYGNALGLDLRYGFVQWVGLVSQFLLSVSKMAFITQTAFTVLLKMSAQHCFVFLNLHILHIHILHILLHHHLLLLHLGNVGILWLLHVHIIRILVLHFLFFLFFKKKFFVFVLFCL